LKFGRSGDLKLTRNDNYSSHLTLKNNQGPKHVQINIIII